LTSGRNAKLYELYRAVGVALGDNLSNYPDETTARQNAQKALTDKKCLLILDDVWELPVGRAFRDLISGTFTRLLITTRNLQINDLLNANEYRLKLIDGSQSADYLRSWVGDDPKLAEIAEKLGYLFLALKLAGARMKKDSFSGADYLLSFDRVSRMKIDRNATDRDDSLEVSIMLSVDAVFAGIENDRLLYHTFGIFQEDAPIPQQIILQLWRYLRPPDVDEFDLLETLNALVDLALVERHENRAITLHNLLLNYTREKLGTRYVQTHQDLLDTYRKALTGDGWHTVIDDSYILDHLIYHLEQAERQNEIHDLFGSADWTKCRSTQSTLGLLNDFEQARQLDTTDLTTRIRYALFSDVVSQRYKNIPVEGLANAIGLGLARADLIMVAIRNMAGDSNAKVRTYLDVVSSRDIPPQLKEQYSEEILRIASQIHDPLERAQLILELLKYVRTDLLSQARKNVWEALFAVDDKKARDKKHELFEHLLKDLPSEQTLALLVDLSKIENIYRRLRFLDRLETRSELSPNVRIQAWTETVVGALTDSRQVSNAYIRIQNLAVLATWLPNYLPKPLQVQIGEDAWQALFQYQHWFDYEFLTEILEPLIPYIPAQYIPQAWERAKNITETDRRAHCMATIAPHLPESLVPDLQREIEGEWAMWPYKPIVEVVIASRSYELTPAQKHEIYLAAWKLAAADLDEHWCRKLLALLPNEIIPILWKNTFEHLRYPPPNKQWWSKTLYRAFLALTRYFPPEQLHNACIIAVDEYSNLGDREYPLLNPEDVGELIAKLVSHLPKSQQEALWLELLDLCLQKPPDKHSSCIQLAFEIVHRMPSQLQTDCWHTSIAQAQAIPNLANKVYVLLKRLEYLPEESRTFVWLNAWDAVFAEEEDFSFKFGWALEKFPLVCHKVVELEANKFRTLDASVWTKAQYMSLTRPRLIGLALLILQTSQQFALAVSERFVDHIISSEPYLKTGIFPYLPEDQQVKELPDLLHKGFAHDEGIAQLAKYWQSDVVCRAWNFICLNMNNENDYRYTPWALALAQNMPVEYTPTAWRMALKKLAPGYWTDWEKVSEAIATRLPTEYLSQAWKEVEEVKAQSRVDSLIDKLKVVIAPRLPQEMIIALADAQEKDGVKTRLPKDIFTCSMAKYLWYGGTLLDEFDSGTLQTVIEKRRQDGKSNYASFVGSFLPVIGLMAYIFVPVIISLLAIYTVLKFVVKRIPGTRQVSWIRQWLKKDWNRYRETPKLTSRDYVYVAFETVLYFIFWLPNKVRRTFNLRWLFGLISYPLAPIFAPYYQIAQNYVMPSGNAAQKLNDVLDNGNARRLAASRSLLQRVGGLESGSKLRRVARDAYRDSQDWWRKAITK